MKRKIKTRKIRLWDWRLGMENGITDLGPTHIPFHSFVHKMQLNPFSLLCHARNHQLSRHATRRRPHLVYLLKNLRLPPQVWLVSAPKRKWLQRDKLKVREFKYQESKTPTLFGEKSSLTTKLSYPLSLLVKWWQGFTTALQQLVLRPKFQVIQKIVPSHWPTRRHGYLQRTTIPVRPRRK